MDRKKILDARIKLEPNQQHPSRLTWTFYTTRDVRHAGGVVTFRKFMIAFIPSRRDFIARGARRVSKRKKRAPVLLSEGMIDYLRTRLPPEAMAACVLASIKATNQPPSPPSPPFASSAASWRSELSWQADLRFIVPKGRKL